MGTLQSEQPGLAIALGMISLGLGIVFAARAGACTAAG